MLNGWAAQRQLRRLLRQGCVLGHKAFNEIDDL